MDFGPYRDGFAEDDDGLKGKLPFPSSSSPSPSPSSSHHQYTSAALVGNNANYPLQRQSVVSGGDTNEDDEQIEGIEREHMFDKVVTPSDVGKLNRLVIPKQHAERYFPLDSSTNEKGLLLHFHDRTGKSWRFRYSYWNSSQSYVMTKGWSRFVKEKKLDAGDIVSFQRGVGDVGRDHLFIDWRRRPDAPDHHHPVMTSLHNNLPFPHQFSFHQSMPSWSPLLMRPYMTRDHQNFSQINNNNNYIGNRNNVGCSYGYGGLVNTGSGSIVYLRSTPVGAGLSGGLGLGVGATGGRGTAPQASGAEAMVYDSVPVVHGRTAAAAKRLRLFGVNMECGISPTESTEEYDDVLSSTPIATSSSSQSEIASSLQLRLFNGTQIPTIPTTDFLNKDKSTMSLDFNI